MPRTIPPQARGLAPRLREALADTPAVLIHGPRQCGKTTLARAVGEPRGYRYLTFDDEAIRTAAVADPIGFVSGIKGRAILDEVQRVPELFTSLKAAIDARRTAGRFILTGSANVLLVPSLADSLAGRMGMLRLHPFAQCELTATRSRFLDRLFRAAFRTSVGDRHGASLPERIVAGGYPAALARRAAARRRAWYRDLVETQVQRDVRDLTRIYSGVFASFAIRLAETSWPVSCCMTGQRRRDLVRICSQYQSARCGRQREPGLHRVGG